MIVDTKSDEMKYILLKFLRDSLTFLSDDPSYRNAIRSEWATSWMTLYLSDESIATWMPKDDSVKKWWETEKAKEQLLKIINEKFRFGKDGEITEREDDN